MVTSQGEDALREFLASLEHENNRPRHEDEAESDLPGKRLSSKEEISFIRTYPIAEGIILGLTSGNMQALLRIEPGTFSEREAERKDLSALEQTIVRCLEQLGIVVGRRDENISKALQLARNRGHARVDVTVAEGVLPVDGKPARLVLLSSDGQIEEPVDTDEEVTRKVLLHQKIFRIDPSVPPIHGQNVFGEEIPGRSAPPIPFNIDNEIQADRESVYRANVEGVLHIHQNRIWLVPLDRDAKIEVTISKDEMSAHLSIAPPSGRGKPAYIGDVQRALQEVGIIYGIQREAMEAAVHRSLRQKAIVKNICVAKGKPPVTGELEEVILTLKPPQFGDRYWIKADGTVDFYNLERIVNVHKGDELATVKPAIPGKPGRSVLGRILEPWKQEEPDLIPGPGIELSTDGRRWYAGVSGQLHQEGRVLQIRKTYHVEGDLDFSTGNIDFVGDVFIRGNVTDGFSVKADGDITVTGSVGIADLDAKGSISVGLGITGKNRTHVRCNGNLVCSFLQEVTVRCGGNLIAGSQILHSDVRVAGTIDVVTGKGTIAGGEVTAGRGIRVNNLGTEYEVKTQLEIGSDWKALEQSLRAGEKIKEIKEKLAILENMLQNAGTDTDPNLVERARREEARMRAALDHAVREQKEARLNLFVDPIPYIDVLGTLHSAVSIRIRDARIAIKHQAKSVRIYYDRENEKIASVRL